MVETGRHSEMPPPEMDSGHDAARLKFTIVAIISLLAVALALKAWDEHQTADETRLALLQQNAMRVADRLDMQSNAVVALLETEANIQAVRSAIVRVSPGVDVIIPFEDAIAAPADTRSHSAALAAEAFIAGNQAFGLTGGGDIVFVGTSPAGSRLLAIAPLATWLPASRDGTQSNVLTGFQVRGAHAEYVPAGGLQRTARACAPVGGQPGQVCLTSSAALFSTADLVRLLILGLLVAAPILVIFGLMTRVRRAVGLAYQYKDTPKDDPSNLSEILRGGMTGYWEWLPEEDAFVLSEAACELMGCPQSCRLKQDEFLDLVHADHRDGFVQGIGSGRITGVLDLTFKSHFNPARWLEFRGSVLELDGKSGVFGGTVADITRRKKSEDRVKLAERRLRSAIESVRVPFALWDQRRRLVFWNRAFASDFRLEETLRVGMTYDTVSIARSGAIRHERVSAEDSATTLFNLVDGRWLQMVERVTPDNGLISICVDISESVRKEEELRAQRVKMKSAVLELERSEGRANELSRKYSEEKAKAEHAAHTKSAFLANMSHELRTPLNAINGFSEIIAHELYGPLGDERYKGYAQDILTSGQHLLDMINDILDMAKIEAGKMTINPQPIDPVDPVDAAVRMIRRKAEEKGVTVYLDTQPNLPEIDADHRAIRQMVLNLVSNAIKFTDSGGTITVTVEQRGPDIQIAVTDTGIGIPAEDLPRLAKPFEQVSGTRDRNYEGTGLGLALTKSFAEMHGGQMHLSSIEGEGTTVSFNLPIGGDTVSADEDDDTRVVA